MVSTLTKPVPNSVRDERGYSQLWSESPSLVVRTSRRATLLAQSLNLRPGGRVLEIGSGVGTKAGIVADLTGCRVTGLDLSEQFTQRARAANTGNDSVEFVCASVAQLVSETPGVYDAIYGDGILHHLVYDLDRSLALLQRLLRPGGSLAFIEPNKANPYVFGIFNVERLRKLTHLEPDEMAFTKTFIATKWTSSGFANVNVLYRDFLVPGTPSFAVGPLTALGAMLEKTRGLRMLSQSLLITGNSPT